MLGLSLLVLSGWSLFQNLQQSPRTNKTEPAWSASSKPAKPLIVTISPSSRSQKPLINYSSIPFELLPTAPVAARPVLEAKVVPSSEQRPEQYIVQPGDSLWNIAKQHQTDVSVLAEANGLSKSQYLQPGQAVRIPPGKGIYYEVQPGESLWEICRRYQVTLQEVLAKNSIPDAGRIRAGQSLFLPGAGRAPEVTDFVWPVQGKLTSGFGYRQHPMGGDYKFHRGIDIASPIGRPVRAAQSGRVLFAGRRGALGLAVIIEHDKQYQTVYGHNSALLVKAGHQVQQGQVISKVGSTGLSTGPHLHFEIRKGGRAVDPRPYLP